MTVTEILIFSIIVGFIDGLMNKKFKTINFIKTFSTVFAMGLIFIIIGKLFLNDLLNKYIPGEKYGLWIFGGFLFLYSIYATIKGFKNKNKNSLH